MGFLARVRAAAAGSAAMLALGVTSSATAVAAPVASFHPIPASVGHVSTQALSFPPTTAFCRANIGIACYQPFQLQKAYNLAPLFSRGIDGRGRTIVIVDAFGS